MSNNSEVILVTYKEGYRRLVEMAKAKSAAACEFVTGCEGVGVYHYKSCPRYCSDPETISLDCKWVPWDDDDCDGLAVIKEFLKTDNAYFFLRWGSEDFDIEVKSQHDDTKYLEHSVYINRDVSTSGRRILDGEAVLQDRRTKK